MSHEWWTINLKLCPEFWCLYWTGCAQVQLMNFSHLIFLFPIYTIFCYKGYGVGFVWTTNHVLDWCTLQADSRFPLFQYNMIITLHGKKCVLLRISSVIFQVENESRDHSPLRSRLIQSVGSVHGDLRQLDSQHHVFMWSWESILSCLRSCPCVQTTVVRTNQRSMRKTSKRLA